MAGVSNGVNPVMMGTGEVDSPGSGSGGFEARPMKFQNNQQINSDWSDEEQAILEQCLAKYAAYNSTNIARYAKISLQLNNKTVRDVALRCRWMAVSGFTPDFLDNKYIIQLLLPSREEKF
ncbi:unnamed protein product [Cuscuta epithymum]|uniref:Myb-like domain-containing protein n=1 Tax=Cuscuta epithymum TaxID=186058 RepID=A0AAV0EAC1_9ASTE|nr:unnamed protein product [Cuscuta epithymum]